MSLRAALGLALLPLGLVACDGTLHSSDDPDAPGGGLDAASTIDASTIGLDAFGPDTDSVPPPPTDTGTRPPTDTGTPPPFDGGPCAMGGLASGLTVTPVAGVTASPPLFGAPLTGGGVAAAFGGGSTTTIQVLAGDGAPFGSPISIDGGELWGFDASPDAYAVIVARGSDALYLVGVGHDGAPRFSQRLLGEVPHDVTNNEWFGALIRYGRLDFTGTEWAAYYTVNRLWPDGIAHYGDQLRMFSPAGEPTSTRWDWGCSHSMEVRIEHNDARLGPVCASDCYPAKGVHFDHRTAQLYTDEASSNCMGGYGTSLGGVVPVSDGFWVTFTATDMRASHDVALVHVGNDGAVGTLTWLTTDGVRDSAVHAARYGSGFVVAWSAEGTDRLARFDASGAMVEGPIDVAGAGLGAASDFFVLEGGDVGWLTAPSGTLALARLRACE
ncbi:MAG: hypothetical protein U0353_18300 [Sandaracinus sp.]